MDRPGSDREGAPTPGGNLPALACPRCRAPVSRGAREEPSLRCRGCGAPYLLRFGIPDLRLAPDPWIGFEEEVAKIERVVARAGDGGFAAAVRAYWEETPETPRALSARYAAQACAGIEREAALLARLDAAGARAGPLLDAGCGTAAFAAAAARAGRPAVGLDIALRWLVIARRRLDEAAGGASGLAALVAGSVAALPFADASFAIVVGGDLVDHLRDPAAGLREIRRVLGPGGLLFLSTPNRFAIGLEPHVRVPFVGWLPAPLRAPWVRLVRGVPYRETHLVSEPALRGLLERAGFVEVRVEAAEPAAGDAERLAGLERAAFPLYTRLWRAGAGRALLRALGPLLEATARAPE